MSDLNKPILQCTLGEFVEALAQRLAPDQVETEASAVALKGIRGIMTIFDCSNYTARKIKQSGVIDDAITQYGAKTYVTNVKKAKELYNNNPIF